MSIFFFFRRKNYANGVDSLERTLFHSILSVHITFRFILQYHVKNSSEIVSLKKVEMHQFVFVVVVDLIASQTSITLDNGLDHIVKQSSITSTPLA